MDGVIRRVVAVEQVQLHASHLNLPGTQPDRVTGQGDFESQPLTIRFAQRCDRQMSGLVIRKERLLRAILVDQLAKIAVLVEQPHANHRHTQVTGGLELIAGHVAQAARVNGQGFAQHEFHAEIRHAVQRGLRVGLLKPPGRFGRLAPRLHQIVNDFAKSRIGQLTLELLP